MIDGVDLLKGFTMDDLRDLLNMSSVAWCNTMLWRVSVIHCEILYWVVLHNIVTLNLTILMLLLFYYNDFIIYGNTCDASRVQIKILLTFKLYWERIIHHTHAVPLTLTGRSISWYENYSDIWNFWHVCRAVSVRGTFKPLVVTCYLTVMVGQLDQYLVRSETKSLGVLHWECMCFADSTQVLMMLCLW